VFPLPNDLRDAAASRVCLPASRSGNQPEISRVASEFSGMKKRSSLCGRVYHMEITTVKKTFFKPALQDNSPTITSYHEVSQE
jgi:hypothetical protein